MEWQNFLNLCICQESQLQRVEDYRRVSLWRGVGGVGGGGVQRSRGAGLEGNVAHKGC
jgi:hypothetical protein